MGERGARKDAARPMAARAVTPRVPIATQLPQGSAGDRTTVCWRTAARRHSTMCVAPAEHRRRHAVRAERLPNSCNAKHNTNTHTDRMVGGRRAEQQRKTKSWRVPVQGGAVRQSKRAIHTSMAARLVAWSTLAATCAPIACSSVSTVTSLAMPRSCSLGVATEEERARAQVTKLTIHTTNKSKSSSDLSLAETSHSCVDIFLGWPWS